MAKHFVTGACLLTIVLAVVAATFRMINVGHFEWIAAGKAVGLSGLMLAVWTSTRRRDAKGANPANTGQPPPRR